MEQQKGGTLENHAVHSLQDARHQETPSSNIAAMEDRTEKSAAPGTCAPGQRKIRQTSHERMAPKTRENPGKKTTMQSLPQFGGRLERDAGMNPANLYDFNAEKKRKEDQQSGRG